MSSQEKPKKEQNKKKKMEQSISNINGQSCFPNFIRANPKSDFFSIKGFHHAEFWCGDATNVANRFSWALGVPISAKSDLSTGNSVHASYLLRSGDMKLLFTAPYSPSISKSTSSSSSATIPTFSVADHRAFTSSHGLAVRALAIEVEDAFSAFNIAVSRGAKPVRSPVSLDDSVILAELKLYDGGGGGGDVVLRLISYYNNKHGTENIKRYRPAGYFLPGFELIKSDQENEDSGIRMLDHALINVPMLDHVVQYLKEFTGFHEFVEYVAEDVGSDRESGLNAVVLANNHENVLLVFAEPAVLLHGSSEGKKSLTQNYLEHNEGGGVHHLALASGDIFKTLREMSRRSGRGGFEFMSPPPSTYYKNLKKRVGGDVLTDEQIKECAELGILVDRDDEGILLQIFTKPVGDRPTFLFEIIQRIGCVEKDENGNDNQKGGCGGLGKGNFSALIKSIEEYEEILLANPTAGKNA